MRRPALGRSAPCAPLPLHGHVTTPGQYCASLPAGTHVALATARSRHHPDLLLSSHLSQANARRLPPARATAPRPRQLTPCGGPPQLPRTHSSRRPRATNQGQLRRRYVTRDHRRRVRHIQRCDLPGQSQPVAPVAPQCQYTRPSEVANARRGASLPATPAAAEPCPTADQGIMRVHRDDPPAHTPSCACKA